MWKIDGPGLGGLNPADGGWFEVSWNPYSECTLVPKLGLQSINQRFSFFSFLFFPHRSVCVSIISIIRINNLHSACKTLYSVLSFQCHLKQCYLLKLRYASVSLENSISCFNFPAVFLWTAKKGVVWVGQWDNKRIFPWRNGTTGWMWGAGKNKIYWVIFI